MQVQYEVDHPPENQLFMIEGEEENIKKIKELLRYNKE